ncbi:MAG TPA: 4'-phosphopantetheinyl transferase superfamily protein [Candidatus Limnocylindrales bacterium]|nr:4'-phosphopantetheinyl transferase superfamily protein [Candidatus Limnocylindrales bacterium]
MNVRFGLDLVSISGVAREVADQGSRYIERTYTAGEIAYSQGAGGIDARRLAERFAVKEATLKVLAVADERIDPRAIELVCDSRGRLSVALHGRAAEIANAEGIGRLAVSVTRDDRLAAAVVAAEVTGADGDPAREAMTR